MHEDHEHQEKLILGYLYGGCGISFGSLKLNLILLIVYLVAINLYSQFIYDLIFMCCARGPKNGPPTLAVRRKLTIISLIVVIVCVCVCVCACVCLCVCVCISLL
jgi:hypothetical protein